MSLDVYFLQRMWRLMEISASHDAPKVFDEAWEKYWSHIDNEIERKPLPIDWTKYGK